MHTSLAIPLVTVLTAALLFTACQPQPTDQSSTQTEVQEQTIQETTSETSARETSITTSYQSPAGIEEVGFTLVVNDAGVITDAETQVLAKAPTSIMRQESFAAEFPTALVGKNLNELAAIDRIGGSSLTTGAFNAALDTLKAQI